MLGNVSIFIVCVFHLIIVSEHTKIEEVGFSLNPFAKEETTFFPISSILKPKVPDHCKDPLRKIVSFMVETSVSRFLPFIEPKFTPEFTQKYKSRKAGDMADNIIEMGLTEGNMARVISRTIAYDLRLLPVVGDKIASKAEPKLEATTKEALTSMCNTLNCCFD